MKRTATLFFLLTFTLIGAAACTERETTTATTLATDTGTDTTMTATDTATQTALQPADQEFINKAAKMGMAEVKLATTVSSRAESEDVRNYAQRMIDDHNRSNEELRSFATGKGMTLPTELDADKRELDTKLASLSGAELDRTYMGAMVQDHTTAVAEFERASKEAADADLRAWAAKTLPVLQEHHKVAQDTLAKLE
jgi:putative membrane protein